MKRSLVTLALMSAFATPAFAQVSIYGIVDLGIQNVKSGGVSVVGVESGLAAESRIGFKGTEDLGNGVSANFVLEHGVALDDGSAAVGTAFSREAWVGLASKNLGEVRFGRQATLLDELMDELDPFGTGYAGDATSFLGYGAYVTRVNNAVTYFAPEFSGLTTKVQYGFGESTRSTQDNRFMSFGADYSRGDLGVNLVYSNQKFNGIGLNEKQTDFLLGATYDFNVAKAHVAYGQTKVEDLMANDSVKLKNYLVGVSAPVGSNGTVMASYIYSNIKDMDDAKSSQFALGYTYGLSKRTKLYASYGHVSNDANVGIKAVADGESTRIVNVGVNHTF